MRELDGIETISIEKMNANYKKQRRLRVGKKKSTNRRSHIYMFNPGEAIRPNSIDFHASRWKELLHILHAVLVCLTSSAVRKSLTVIDVIS